MKLCPCCSNKNYADCCAPFLAKGKNPETAEKLMRSRYTAYYLCNLDYIEKTMLSPALKNFDKVSTLAWAKQVQWLGLKICSTRNDPQEPNISYVEFIAEYELSGKIQTLHEISKFRRQNNVWFYVDGIFLG